MCCWLTDKLQELLELLFATKNTILTTASTAITILTEDYLHLILPVYPLCRLLVFSLPKESNSHIHTGPVRSVLHIMRFSFNIVINWLWLAEQSPTSWLALILTNVAGRHSEGDWWQGRVVKEIKNNIHQLYFVNSYIKVYNEDYRKRQKN